MVPSPHWTTVRGPTFIRLLARLTDVDVASSRQSLSDRLSHWLDWSHAVALSTVLDGRPSTDGLDVPTFGSAEEDECARARSTMALSIAGDRAFTGETGIGETSDYATFRQRYLAMQRKMQATTGHLRGRLRDMLALRSSEMAQLAAVDAVMERALSPREQMLLAAVPHVLGQHFERLQEAAQRVPSDEHATQDAPAATPGAWLDGFRRDMLSVLLAELDVRFQPVEGLLEALRTR
jgi:hypothetical protein